MLIGKLAGTEPQTAALQPHILLARLPTHPPCTVLQMRGGFPPKLLEFPADAAASISSLGIQSGDSLTVTRLAGSSAAASAAIGGTATGTAAAAAPSNGHHALAGLSEDEQLARAIALSLGETVPDASAVAPPPAAPSAPLQQRRAPSPARSHPAGSSVNTAQQGAPISAALPDGTAVVRRIIDSDNSCLFNAVGYVAQHSRRLAPQLRWGVGGVGEGRASAGPRRSCHGNV